MADHATREQVRRRAAARLRKERRNPSRFHDRMMILIFAIIYGSFVSVLIWMSQN